MSLARCDICCAADGYKGLELVTCGKCKVSVHIQCYGLTELSTAKFVVACPACKAVGKDIIGRTKKGELKVVTQSERPAECVLCSVKTGTHCMHPFYDVDGKRGCQLVLASGKLAWVHTLCATSVCQHRSTRGCVYGCDITGKADDGTSDNDESVADSVDDTPIDVTLHHFVMCNRTHQEYWPAIEQSKNLVCIGCGKKGELRIPLQCTAGDSDEYAPLKRLHQNVLQPCVQAMHVGCARWLENRGPHRQIFIFPGSDNSDPVFECYCPKHARDLAVSDDGENISMLRRKSDSMIGYTRLEDAVGIMEMLQSPRRSTKLVESSVKSDIKARSEKRLAQMVQSKSSAEFANRTDKHSSQVLQAQPTEKTAKQTEKRLAQIVQLRATEHGPRGVERTSSPASPSQPNRNAENLHSNVLPKATLLLTKETSKESIRRHIARSSNEPSTIVAENALGTTKSPTIAKTTREIIAADNALEIPSFSGSLPRKKSSNVTRGLASYVTAAQQIAAPPIAARNATDRRASFSIITKEAPAPPPYQRTSTLTDVRPISLGNKRKRASTSQAINQVRTDKAETAAEATASVSKKSWRRRYISESKMEDDYFPDDFDWEGAIRADVETALSVGKKEGIDSHHILEARHCYWRRKSGLYGTAFSDFWNKAIEKFQERMNPHNHNEVVETSGTTFAFNVDEDADRSTFSGINKWANMWATNAALFEFGDWDSETEVMKRGMIDA